MIFYQILLKFTRKNCTIDKEIMTMFGSEIMNKKLYIKEANETIELGFKLGSLLNVGDVVLLDGDLSAGKTTLTKGIGKALGVTKIINSPTFTIVKAYEGRIPLYHLDLYRLDGLNEDFELFDYVDGDGVCVIEWPNQAEELLPENYLLLNMKIVDGGREIEIIAKGPRYEKIVGELNV